MNRDEQEMVLWREAYSASRIITRAGVEAEADAAVAAFRKRYPPQPSAPEAVWYDEPPFEKIDKTHYCWVEDIDSPQGIFWSNMQGEWRFFEGLSVSRPLNGCRVSPIIKPQEPTT